MAQLPATPHPPVRKRTRSDKFRRLLPKMCVRKCDCTDLPKWFEHSALFAVNRGVALCPNTLCFGGQL